MIDNEIKYTGNNLPHSSLRDILRILFRRRKAFALIFFAGIIIVSAVTYFSPYIYRSEASLLVKLGRESVMLDPTATMGQIANVRQDRTKEINSELQILHSRDLAEMAVNKLGVDVFQGDNYPTDELDNSFLNKYRQKIKDIKPKITERIKIFLNIPKVPEEVRMQTERDKIISKIMANFSAQAVTESDVISLSYENENPIVAQKVLHELILNYLDKHMAVHRTSGSYGFFEQQTANLKTDLQDTGRNLTYVKNQTGIASLDQQRSLLLQRIDSLKRESEETEASLAASEIKATALKNNLAIIPKTMVQAQITGSPSSAVEELRKQVYLLKLQEQETLSKFAAESVPAKEIRRQISSAEDLLSKAYGSKQITTGNNSTYQQLEMNLLLEESNYMALKAKAQTLKTQLLQVRDELKRINDYELQINDLQRELEIREVSYRKYADSQEQARIDNALEIGKISNISIAQPSTVPVDPIRPKKALDFVLGLFLALACGIGIAVLKEYMDHTYSIPEDIEKKLGIPSLGSLPKLTLRELNKLVSGNGGGHYYLTTENVRSLPGLNKTLELQNVDNGSSAPIPYRDSPRTIAVTSSRKGEGASTVAIYLASMLIQHFEGNVLLVDANFEDPSIHKIMGGRKSPGLADILSQKHFDTEIFQPTNQDGLNFIAAGEKHPPYLRWSERKYLAKLLDSLKQKYDFVVVDMPALWNGRGPEATNFEALADGVVMVIEAEKSRWEVTQRASDRLLRMNATILGAVLNKRCYHIPKWIYSNL